MDKDQEGREAPAVSARHHQGRDVLCLAGQERSEDSALAVSTQGRRPITEAQLSAMRDERDRQAVESARLGARALGVVQAQRKAIELREVAGRLGVEAGRQGGTVAAQLTRLQVNFLRRADALIEGVVIR